METRTVTPDAVWKPAVPAGDGSSFSISGTVPFLLWLGEGEPAAADLGHIVHPGAIRDFTLPAGAGAYVKTGGWGIPARVMITETPAV